MRWILLLLFLSSCLLRTPFHDPSVDLPCKWRLETNEASVWANIRWWEQFGDPTLNCLIKEALWNNEDLQIAVARVVEYYGKLGIVRASLYPEINGNGSFVRQRTSQVVFPPIPPNISPVYNTYELFATLNYQLDVWGQLHSATDAAVSEFWSAIENRKQAVLTLVQSVARGYIFLRQLDEQLQISKDTLKSRIESLRLAVLRFEEGLTSEVEVMQATAERDTAALQVVEYETDIQVQENLLSVLVGRNPGPICRGLELQKLTLPFDVPAGLPAELLEQRPDISKARFDLMAAAFRVNVALANFFPQINLTGAYGNASTELHQLLTSPALIWQYGINFLQPLFDGGRIASGVVEAKAIRDELLHTYFSVIQHAFAEVDDALISHKNSKVLILIQQDQVKSLRRYLYLATLQYNNGQTDYLNVLDAERSLFSSQLNLAAAQGNAFFTLIDLYAALGGGWVIDADDTLRGKEESQEVVPGPNPCDSL